MMELTKEFMQDIIKGRGFGVAPSAVEEMARQLLAGLEKELIILYRERNPYNGMSTGWIELTPDEYDFIKDNASDNADFKTVYAAPQLPQPAVAHDLRDSFEAWAISKGWNIERGVTSGDYASMWTYDAWEMVNACRAAMLQGADGTLTNEGTIPATKIKPVADLYSITVPGGRSATYSTDTAEASDCRVMGWAVQEYVKLERYQDAMLGAEPAATLKRAIFIDGSISPDGADKLADTISKLNSEHRESQQMIAEPAQGWIPCGERMPEGSEEVLCAKEFDGPDDWRKKVGYWLAGKWTVYGASWTPTHWMPMPAAPQQEVTTDNTTQQFESLGLIVTSDERKVKLPRCSKHPETELQDHPFEMLLSYPPKPAMYCPLCRPSVAKWVEFDNQLRQWKEVK